MTPTIGRIVHYRLSADDAEKINRRRTTGHSIAERMKMPPGDEVGTVYGWPEGAQAHIGNSVDAGQVFPMLITAVWPTTVSGQVFLDGCDVFWATSREESPNEDGHYFWPMKIGA